jgi:hypothetical protein
MTSEFPQLVAFVLLVGIVVDLSVVGRDGVDDEGDPAAGKASSNERNNR